MILYILVFAVLCLFIVTVKHQNSYVWLFITRLVLINLMLLFTTFLNVKLANYYALFEWEAKVYLFLSSIKMNYYAIFDIYVILLAAYMVTSVCAVIKNSSAPFGKKIAMFVVSLIPVALFTFMNFSANLLNIYYDLISGQSLFSEFISKYINAFNVVVVLMYTVIPYAVFSLTIVKSSLKSKKKYLSAILVLFLAIDAIFAIVFLRYVPYKTLLMYSPDFLRSPSMVSPTSSASTPIVVIILLCCVMLCVFVVKSRMFDDAGFGKVIKRPKNVTIRFDDTRTVFHTCKNILLSIEFVRKRMEKKNPTPEIQEGLDEIHGLLDDALNRLTYMLNIYNQPTEIISEVELSECLEAAVKKSKTGEFAEVKLNLPDEKIIIMADYTLLEEAFINVIKNAGEALETKDPLQRRIDITAICEGGLVGIYIRDNGCGISRKERSKVFDPLFSTKKTAKNWGMGLSYVSNVATALGGTVAVDSIKDKFTEFEILLPVKGIER